MHVSLVSSVRTRCLKRAMQASTTVRRTCRNWVQNGVSLCVPPLRIALRDSMAVHVFPGGSPHGQSRR
eukprot:6197132-Pleurochrysis_carterae.AAC.1